MLADTTVEAFIGNFKVKKRIQRECQQSHVLSLLLWNFNMDDLLTKLQTNYWYAYSQGLADGLVSLLEGMDRLTMMGSMQRVINFVNI